MSVQDEEEQEYDVHVTAILSYTVNARSMAEAAKSGKSLAEKDSRHMTAKVDFTQTEVIHEQEDEFFD